ncbi:MAG: glycosyltransferase family 4 protein [Gemmatimonadales bacterium]
MTARVAHLTSAHPRHDVRIWAKECRTLAAAGHEVTLVVADDLGEELRGGVRILGVGSSGSRWGRMCGASRRVVRAALETNPDIVHLHDPELLPAVGLLRRERRRVVYDAHEDLPGQILSKPYLWRAARRPIATAARVFLAYACRQVDAVVAARPDIGVRLARVNPATVVVNNYPLADELFAEPCVDMSGRPPVVTYVGGMSAIRGIPELVDAMALVREDVRLQLVGGFTDRQLGAQLRTRPGWGRVKERGWLDRAGVRAALAGSIAGVVTFKPAPNHLEAQPTKLFEYMSAGIPVIASGFPAWRQVVEELGCGVCVEPGDPAGIARAIDWLARNPGQRRQMGANGRRAIQARYNWASEEATLTGLYDRLARGMT